MKTTLKTLKMKLIMNKNRQHSSNLNFSTIMKKVLFTAALLLVAGFTFAQEKSVKEAKRWQVQYNLILPKQKN